ncbi:heparan sulfate glucosamine 3-O-sulfotransferase 1-like [Ciona intestinalis]
MTSLIIVLILLYVIILNYKYWNGGLTESEMNNDAEPNKKLKRLPQVIGIGVKKCGTGALKSFLGFHPKVEIYTANQGEAHFFDVDENFERGPALYRLEMPFTDADQITFEKTPKYFTTPAVGERIKYFYDKVKEPIKLVVIFCEPAARAYSEYMHITEHGGDVFALVRKLASFGSFENYVAMALDIFYRASIAEPNSADLYGFANFADLVVNIKNSRELSKFSIISDGFYSIHLNEWLKSFKASDFHFMDGDLFMEGPAPEMGRLTRFLGVDDVFQASNFTMDEERGFFCLKEENEEEGARCAPEKKGRTRSLTLDGKVTSDVDPGTLMQLKELYSEYNMDLDGLTGLSFNWNN